MDSFKEFDIKDTHKHPNFNKMFSCFIIDPCSLRLSQLFFFPLPQEQHSLASPMLSKPMEKSHDIS
jgi:hypothetical protein